MRQIFRYLITCGMLSIPAAAVNATVPSVTFLASQARLGQTGESLLPPAKCGECFARVMVPAQYHTEAVTVTVKAATERLEVIPPEFTYEEKTVQITPEYKTLRATKSRYSTVRREIVETPKHKLWKQGKRPLQTINHSTGEITCLVEVPETYQNYQEKVVSQAPEVIEELHPARYKTVRIKKLVKAAEVRRVTVPAETRTLERRVKTSDARIEWQPVLCETNADRATVRKIQRGLRDAGHYDGRIDGKLDRVTMRALRAFQSQRGLPVGQVTLVTLSALGITGICDDSPAPVAAAPVAADRDKDGIPDDVDVCPDEPGKKEYEGCNEKQLVKIEGDKIIILEKVYFDFAKSTIQERSYPLLGNVARVLKSHPSIRVRVEGHTDSKGPEAANTKLSQARSSAVKRYLMKQGIKGSRMRAKGYGESKPVASNATDEGRAQNRRVEFTIISR